ncbi:MAG: branched-chain amino acid ABC transporter substrate-binding protein [Bauldia sp.]|nr:branched-chain amino acid ABC transporter substrate-binding protein [Bauldia sp.]
MSRDRRMRRTFRSLIVAVATAAALASAPPAAAQIRIGVAGPMTGAIGQLGGELVAGAEAAVSALNAAGGVLGQQVRIEVADDATAAAACSDDQRAPAVANQLAGAGVVFVVGHLCSAASIAAATVYAAEGIVQIAPGAPDPRFTDDRAGPGVFRLFGRADAQAGIAAAHIATQFAGVPVAVVDDQTEYGRSLGGAIRGALGGLGIPLAFNESYRSSSVDLVDLVRRIGVSDAGLVYFAGNAAEAARLRLELTSQGSTAVLFGGDALADPDFTAAAGEAADGAIFTYPPDPATGPTAADAVAAMRAAGLEPTRFSLHAYAAVEIWAAAVAEAGTTNLAPVAREIAAGTFETVLGPVTFNADGEADLVGWVVHEWRGTAYMPLPSP